MMRGKLDALLALAEAHRLPARAAAGLLRRAQHALRQLRQLPDAAAGSGTAPMRRASCCPPSTACSSKAASASAPATSWTSCAARRPRRSSSSATSAISTFGIGAEFSEAQLRGVLRQLIATGALAVDAEALQHAAAHRRLARRAARARPRCCCANRCRSRGARRAQERARPAARATASAPPRPLDAAGQARFAALKAWRAEVAREHNLPAYVIFHDATLAAIAERARARWTTCRASAASARRSWRPTARTCCGCSPACARRGDSPRRPVSSVQAIHAADCPPAMARADDTPDDALMTAYAAGDAAAFERLYARHQAGCTASCAACSARAGGADRRGVPGHLAARGACARSAGSRRARAFAPGCSRWRTTARSTCCGAAVARCALERDDDGDEPWEPDGAAWQHWPAPAGAAPRARTWRSGAAPASGCCECLEQLPLAQRSAFLLHHDDGLPLDEIARALEVGFETAKTPAALCDEQAAHLHGRLPRAAAPRRAR